MTHHGRDWLIVVSMTKITIENPNSFPERNQAKQIITDMISREYQIEVDTHGIVEGGCAFVTFHKGIWEVQINGRNKKNVSVSDAPCVFMRGLGPMNIEECYVQSRIDYYLEKCEDGIREVPSLAIYAFLNFYLHIDTTDKVVIRVHQPGRNGSIEGLKIITNRKDW